MKGHWLKDQRGSVLLFTTVIMVFLLVIGGFAIDLTYHGAAKGELQRSMDAAVLAGAPIGSREQIATRAVVGS